MYKIPGLANKEAIRHLISGSSDGNMSFRFGEKDVVVRNRKKFLETNGIGINNCVAMRVMDSDQVVEVDASFAGRGMDSIDTAVHADVLVTQEKNLYLFLLTADCLPIIVYDPHQPILALMHCGWKSTDLRLAAKLLNYLKMHHHVNPADLVVGVGPAIHGESYEFENPVQKTKPEWQPFLLDLPNGKTGVDLIGYNKQQLVDAGVPEEKIYISEKDTVKEIQFYSHYRDLQAGVSEAGRFVTVASITYLVSH